MTDLGRFRIIVGISTLLFVFMTFSGCASLKQSEKSSEESKTSTSKQKKEQAPLYYDFEDVLLPTALKVDKNRSFVYQSPEFTAGVLVLTGRVEPNSLIQFFDNNMAKDNWRLVSSFKSPRTMMFFDKPTRSCIINITEGHFKTEVEIWIAPSLETNEQELLK